MASVVVPILERLKADASVSALIAGRVFAGMASQKVALPYVTFTVVAVEPLNTMGPAQQTDRHATMQVDCWAATYQVVDQLRKAVNESLAGHRDQSTDPAIDSMLQTAERDLPEPPEDGSDTPIHRISQDYSIWYTET